MSNSVDPDETAYMSLLIWIYFVCKSLLLLPVTVKELNYRYLDLVQTCGLISLVNDYHVDNSIKKNLIYVYFGSILNNLSKNRKK